MSRAEKRELNQHLHRRHGGLSLAGSDMDSLLARLSHHEKLHKTTVCDHEHEDYEQPSVLHDLVKDA